MSVVFTCIRVLEVVLCFCVVFYVHASFGGGFIFVSSFACMRVLEVVLSFCVVFLGDLLLDSVDFYFLGC